MGKNESSEIKRTQIHEAVKLRLWGMSAGRCEICNDEFDFLLREVKKLKENGVSLTDICVVARTKKLVDDYIALFTRAGIRSYAIKRNKADDRSFDGLRVATMHRVKGLEFKYVFIAAVNNRIIPMPSAINKTDVVSEAESITSEKCLLYVAMTRAQKGVYITSYGRPSEFLGQPFFKEKWLPHYYEPDHHKWTEYVGDRVRKSKDVVWGILVEEWCKQCLGQDASNYFIEMVRNALI